MVFFQNDKFVDVDIGDPVRTVMHVVKAVRIGFQVRCIGDFAV